MTREHMLLESQIYIGTDETVLTTMQYKKHTQHNVTKCMIKPLQKEQI